MILFEFEDKTVIRALPAFEDSRGNDLPGHVRVQAVFHDPEIPGLQSISTTTLTKRQSEELIKGLNFLHHLAFRESVPE